MSEQPRTGPNGQNDPDNQGAEDRSAGGGDNLHVTPGVAGPSGTGEQTDRGGDQDAEGVSEGADGGQQ